MIRSDRHITERPEYFTLNPNNDLSQGLVFAGLGRFPGGLRYDDATESLNGGGSPGTLTNMDPATDWVWSPVLGRWTTDCVKASSQSIVTGSLATLSNSRTIAMWIAAHELGSTDPVFSLDKLASTQDGTIVDYQGASGFRFFGYAGGTAIGLGTTGALPTTPFHWSGTFNGTTWTQYINGAVAGSPTNSAGTLNAADGGLVLGSRPANFGSITVADPCVYGRVLSLGEISALADPSNVMLEVGGVPLILPPHRVAFPAAVVEPVLTYRNYILGGGVF